MSDTSTAKQIVEAFLQSGTSVCPFTKTCIAHYGQLDPFMERQARRDSLALAKEFEGTFGMTPPHALIILGPAQVTSDWNAFSTWATNVFGHLFLAFLRVGSPEVTFPEALQVTGVVRKILLDEHDIRRPFMACGRDPLHTVGMSPMYRETHPRWAPYPIVVSTWAEDVAKLQTQPAARKALHNKMFAAFGGSYDADTLILPREDPHKRSAV